MENVFLPTNFFMKKFLAPVAALVSSSVFFVQSTLAALPEPPDITGLADPANNGTQGVKDTIVEFIVKVLDFIMLIAVIYVIVAGIRLIVSGGDEGEKDKAKNTIIYVIVGILVVLFARVIVTFAGTFIGS